MSSSVGNVNRDTKYIGDKPQACILKVTGAGPNTGCNSRKRRSAQAVIRCCLAPSYYYIIIGVLLNNY